MAARRHERAGQEIVDRCAMMTLPLAQPGERLSILCIGAHADDIEIGAGGTLLGWIDAGLELEVNWWVLSAEGRRAAEAEASAAAFLSGAVARQVRLAAFPDNRFPSHSDAIKDWLLDLREEIAPQVEVDPDRETAGAVF